MGRKKNPYKDIELSKRERRIFDFMWDFGSITSLEAFTELGETRLSGCIFQLRQKGINISTETIAVFNRYKEKRYVKKYYIG